MGRSDTKASELLHAKFVRVMRRRDNGLVEFDFAIGAPEVFVELMMPEAAFDEFCRTNAIVDLTDQTAPEDDFSVRLSRVLAGQGE
ncbi:MAG: toluene monooxygenase [Alphaproteobacteria bacterium]|nr:toluene monooxygenase [Alphaproteobacteria bacterium]